MRYITMDDVTGFAHFLCMVIEHDLSLL